MAIEHENILDADRHEVKGASTATSGHALFALTGDNTEFRKIQTSDIGDYVEGVSEISVDEEFVVHDLTDQLMAAAGDEQQITFGGADTSANGHVSLAADGTITFNTNGLYSVKITVAPGRTSSASDSVICFRGLYNGMVQGFTRTVQIDDSGVGTVSMVNESYLVEASAGDTLSFEQRHDQDGGGSAGIRTYTPGGGWSISPSASLFIYKFGLE